MNIAGALKNLGRGHLIPNYPRYLQENLFLGDKPRHHSIRKNVLWISFQSSVSIIILVIANVNLLI